MKRLILLLYLVVFSSSLAFADELYHSTIATTKLVKVENDFGDYLKLDLPFKVYGQNIVCNGSDITYNMSDLKLEGKEVMAKVDYKVEDVEIVKKFIGNIGSNWKDVQKHAKYVEHYNYTKEDALATSISNGEGGIITTPYAGADKDDLVKFTQWDID